MAIRPRRDEEAIGNLAAFIVLLVAIGILLGVYYAYVVPVRPEAALVALPGDTVLAQYVGTFEATGAVFDTSSLTVARDNASYLKAFSFSWRARWEGLTFKIGDGTMIPGFDRGVIGMREDETKTIRVPPADGYGAADPSKVVSRLLVETVPVRITMDLAEFAATYSGEPSSGAQVIDPVWGWPAIVTVADAVATVTNSPEVGSRIRPYGGWDAIVVSIDDAANEGEGAIVVRHLLETGHVDLVGGAEDGADFYVSAVDPLGGTWTQDFNRQVVGRTLIFVVTLTSITRL